MKISLLLGLLLLISCSNREAKNEMKYTVDSILMEGTSKIAIHPQLRSRIKELLDDRLYKDFPGIPIEESCLVLYSWLKSENSSMYSSDSTINMIHNICKENNDYYKGVIKVDEINIAIFDYGKFLDDYYNSDSLLQISYDSFKCYPTNIISRWEFYIKDGELNY